MKTNTEIDEFKKRIERLIRHTETEERKMLTASAASRHHRNHDVYQTIAANILKHVIEPRIEIVADMLEDASIEVNAEIGYVRLSFLASKLPARLYLLLCLRLDHSARMVRLYAESCLRPYTMDYKPSGSIMIPLNSPNMKKVKVFIEEHILKFLKGYLRLHREEKYELRHIGFP